MLQLSCEEISEKSEEIKKSQNDKINEGVVKKLIGTWINFENEFIYVNEKRNDEYSRDFIQNGEFSQSLELEINKDTLSFQFKYYSGEDNFKNLRVRKYDFLTIQITDTVLIVQPISDLSKEFYENKDTVRLIRQEYLVDESIEFEKLIFHTTRCFGSCPIYHLQIKNDRSIQLHKEEILKNHSMMEIDEEKIGYFEGNLTDDEYEEFIKILKTSNLRNLKFNGITCCDGSTKTIIVYFNGQRRYLKSMFPPGVASRLINYLYYICSKPSLKKTNEILDFEK